MALWLFYDYQVGGILCVGRRWFDNDCGKTKENQERNPKMLWTVFQDVTKGKCSPSYWQKTEQTLKEND